MGKRAVRFNSSAISDALKFSSGCALKKDSKSRLCLVIYMATPPSFKETPKITIRFYDKRCHNAQSDHDLISASLIFIICQSSSVCKWKTKNRFPRRKTKKSVSLDSLWFSGILISIWREFMRFLRALLLSVSDVRQRISGSRNTSPPTKKTSRFEKLFTCIHRFIRNRKANG